MVSEIGLYISHGTKALEIRAYIAVLWGYLYILFCRGNAGSLRLAADTGESCDWGD